MAALGINPARAKLAAMMLSSFFAAIGGTFYAQLVGFITPTRTMSLDFSVQMVIMAVLGGVGTVLGPLWGAMVLVPIAEITRALWGGSLQGVHLIVYGALLMIVILYWPQGIDPWVRRGVDALARAWAAGARSPAPRPPWRTRRASVLPERGLLAAPAGAQRGRDGAERPRAEPALRRRRRRARRHVRRRAGRGGRHHRRQRRGQDDALQPDHRGPQPRRRARSASRGDRLDRESARRAQPPRHRAHVSDRAAVHRA